MDIDHNSLKEHLNPGLELFPEVDLEAVIMVAVREEARLRKDAKRLRRRGLVCLTVFLLLLALALWNTSSGYSHPIYQNQLAGYGMPLLFLLILFAQLEAWKGRFALRILRGDRR